MKVTDLTKIKIVAHNQYWAAVGGGEAHFGKLLEVLSQCLDVEILFISSIDYILETEKRFHLDLSRCKKTKVFNLDSYSAVSRPPDIFICYNHHADIKPFGKFNILFATVPRLSPHIEKYDLILANSKFTQRFFTERKFNNVKVLCPYVDSEYFGFEKKEKIILSVNRFNTDLHQKNQLQMIERFKRMNLHDWEFVLIGGAKFTSEIELLQRCHRAAANNKRIKIFDNATFEQTINFNKKASIYWHATGVKQDNPELVEHFGMSVMNAMAAGAVPLVVDRGEPPNLVEFQDQIWSEWPDLEILTRWWIAHQTELLLRSSSMISKSKLFTEEIFEKKVIDIFSELLK